MADAGGEMSTTNMIVWLVRIALPIIFFWIWYRSGPGKGQSSSGPTYHRRSREEFLHARKAVKYCDKPASLSNLKMVEEARVTGGSSSGSRPARGNQGTRAKRGDKARNMSSDSLGMKGDRSLSGEMEPFEYDGGGSTPLGANVGSNGPIERVVEKTGRAALNDEEIRQFESLLTFVAFSHKDRPQRAFLFNDGCPPPPPPLKRPPVADMSEVETPESLKANMDAQMVLKGVVNSKIGLKRSAVAKDLHEQLCETQVRISEASFALMVETCINGGDLKGASGFLMKMESNGFCPDSGLLDKVMDLYSESRAAEASAASENQAQKEQAPLEKPPPPWSVGNSASKERLSNSSTGDPQAYEPQVADQDLPSSPATGSNALPYQFQESPRTREPLEDADVSASPAFASNASVRNEDSEEQNSERVAKLMAKKAERKARKVRERLEQEGGASEEEFLAEAAARARAEREEAEREAAALKEKDDAQAAKKEAAARKTAAKEAAEKEAINQVVAKEAREREETAERERVEQRLVSLSASCAEEPSSKDVSSARRREKASGEKKKKEKGQVKEAAAAHDVHAKEAALDVQAETTRSTPPWRGGGESQPSAAADPAPAIADVMQEDGFEAAPSSKQKKSLRAQQRAEEEEARRRAEDEAKRKADAEAQRQEQEEADRKAEEEEAKRKSDEETKRKAEEEAKRQEEEELQRKADEDAKRKADEEAKRKAEEEEKRKADAEAKRRLDEEAKRRAEEEEAWRKEEERKQAERDAKAAKKHAEARAAEAAAKAPQSPPVLSSPNAHVVGMKVDLGNLFADARAAELAAKRGVDASGGSERTALEKEILKIEKKLREVEKLKEKIDAGETLATNQLEKVAKGEALGPRLAELQLQRALERAEELKLQEELPPPPPPADEPLMERPDYSPGTPEPGDIEGPPMPTRTPLRQWARDARGASPFVGIPGIGPGMSGKGMPQAMPSYAPTMPGKGQLQETLGEALGGLPQGSMPMQLCAPCIPTGKGDMRTPLGQPPDQDGRPQFMQMFSGAPMQGPDGSDGNGRPMFFAGPGVQPLDLGEMSQTGTEDRWECCWEWVKSGWCPRGMTCRWEHPPLGPSLAYGNGVQMQQYWPEDEAAGGGASPADFSGTHGVVMVPVEFTTTNGQMPGGMPMGMPGAPLSMVPQDLGAPMVIEEGDVHPEDVTAIATPRGAGF